MADPGDPDGVAWPHQRALRAVSVGRLGENRDASPEVHDIYYYTQDEYNCNSAESASNLAVASRRPQLGPPDLDGDTDPFGKEAPEEPLA